MSILRAEPGSYQRNRESGKDRKMKSRETGEQKVKSQEHRSPKDRKQGSVQGILYLFDDINYKSGAQKAMFLQMEALSLSCPVSVFSLTEPERGCLPKGVRIFGENTWERSALFSRGMRAVWKDQSVSFKRKLRRAAYSMERRLWPEEDGLQRFLEKHLGRELENFHTIIVVSEASKLRRLAAGREHPRKIQWIHTDYARWSCFSEWTRRVCRKDEQLYQKFDRIVTLSEKSRKELLGKLPELGDRAVVIPNLIDGERIRRRAKEQSKLAPDPTKCNFITVGRLEREKAYDRILNLCSRLRKGAGKAEEEFCWYIVGDGSLKEHLEKRIAAEGLRKCVKLTGRLENPYPLMRQCNYFVLLSEYEGTPVTIDEAMVLGVPVLAADVGGIREQLERGRASTHGKVLPGTDEEIWYSELQRAIGAARGKNFSSPENSESFPAESAENFPAEGTRAFPFEEFNQRVLIQLRRLLAGTE